MLSHYNTLYKEKQRIKLYGFLCVCVFVCMYAYSKRSVHKWILVLNNGTKAKNIFWRLVYLKLNKCLSLYIRGDHWETAKHILKLLSSLLISVPHLCLSHICKTAFLFNFLFYLLFVSFSPCSMIPFNSPSLRIHPTSAKLQKSEPRINTQRSNF